MKQWKLGLAVVLGISGLFSGRAIAAEEIILRYGILERTVAVSDLSQLAETGEATSQLQSYFDTAQVPAEEVQNMLNSDVTVDGININRILDNPLGDVLLDEVSKSIYPESGSAGRQAMRAALVLSAVDDDRITVIEVLENYPTSRVVLDTERLAATYEDFQEVGGVVVTVEDTLNDVLNVIRILETLSN